MPRKAKRSLPPFSTLWKPSLMMLAASLIYAGGYLLAINAGLGAWMLTGFETLWLSLYGLALYAVYLQTIGAFGAFASTAGKAWAGALAAALFGALILTPLSLPANWAASILSSLMGIVCLLMVVPGLVVWFVALSEQPQGWKDALAAWWTLVREKGWQVLELWAGLFLLLCLWDTLLGGPLYLPSAMSASWIGEQLLFVRAPMLYPLLMVTLFGFSSSTLGLIIVQFAGSLLLCYGTCVWFAWLPKAQKESPKLSRNLKKLRIKKQRK